MESSEHGPARLKGQEEERVRALGWKPALDGPSGQMKGIES